MIEAPEAAMLAAQINKVVKGKTITEVVSCFSPHKFTWFYGDHELYKGRLEGKRVDGAVAQGGMVQIDIEDVVVVLTDGVNLKYIEPGVKLPSKHQLLIGFNDESCITCSVRMYGGIMCFPAEEKDFPLSEYYFSAKDKPQVMSPDFTYEYFLTIADDPRLRNKSVKALLATGQSIPGLGNGVLQDILYNACIHPKTKTETLHPKDKKRLYDAIVSTLGEIKNKGGRSSESDLFGNKGGYRPYLSKDTAGKECGRCSHIIMKENYLGGSIYYCPGCQKIAY